MKRNKIMHLKEAEILCKWGFQSARGTKKEHFKKSNQMITSVYLKSKL
jgi:hypothetical protein